MAGLAQKGGAVFSHVKIARAAGRHPCGAGRRRRSRPRARRRSRRRRRQVGAGDDARQRDRRRRRQRRTVPRRLHPPARLRPAGRAGQGVDPGALRRRRALRRGERGGDGACSARPPAPTWSCSATPIRRGCCRSARRRCRRAIELNGEATATNLAAFDWGRALVADPAALAAFMRPAPARGDDSLEALVERRAAFLTDYQDRAYAERYRACVALAAQGRARTRAGRRRLRRDGRPRPVQTDGLQGRIRSRAPLQRRRVRRRAERRLRRRSQADVLSRAVVAGARRRSRRRAEKDRLSAHG